MAKEKFNWKGLFITEEDSGNENTTEYVRNKSTPSANAFPETAPNSTKFPEERRRIPVDDSVLGAIIEMYESGFDSLNQPGYDFYEFFKAIKAVDSDSPQIYKMAITMARSVDPKVTKTTLLTQADFYIQEIEKVHGHYETQGNTRKRQIQDTQRTKKANLTADISALEKKLLEIQNQISEKKNELQSIDANMLTDVADIDQKIVANDTARTKILETITSVVQGIKNNI